MAQALMDSYLYANDVIGQQVQDYNNLKAQVEQFNQQNRIAQTGGIVNNAIFLAGLYPKAMSGFKQLKNSIDYLIDKQGFVDSVKGNRFLHSRTTRFGDKVELPEDRIQRFAKEYDRNPEFRQSVDAKRAVDEVPSEEYSQFNLTNNEGLLATQQGRNLVSFRANYKLRNPEDLDAEVDSAVNRLSNTQYNMLNRSLENVRNGRSTFSGMKDDVANYIRGDRKYSPLEDTREVVESEPVRAADTTPEAVLRRPAADFVDRTPFNTNDENMIELTNLEPEARMGIARAFDYTDQELDEFGLPTMPPRDVVAGENPEAIARAMGTEITPDTSTIRLNAEDPPAPAEDVVQMRPLDIMDEPIPWQEAEPAGSLFNPASAIARVVPRVPITERAPELFEQPRSFLTPEGTTAPPEATIATRLPAEPTIPRLPAPQPQPQPQPQPRTIAEEPPSPQVEEAPAPAPRPTPQAEPELPQPPVARTAPVETTTAPSTTTATEGVSSVEKTAVEGVAEAGEETAGLGLGEVASAALGPIGFLAAAGFGIYQLVGLFDKKSVPPPPTPTFKQIDPEAY